MNYCDTHKLNYPLDGECRLCKRAASSDNNPDVVMPGLEAEVTAVGTDRSIIEVDGSLDDAIQPSSPSESEPTSWGLGLDETPRPEPEPEPFPAYVPPPTVARSDGDVSAEQLQELIKKDAKVVLLLGFSGAGKTWFLNRLKYELAQRDQIPYSCVPAHARRNGMIGRSNSLTLHYFTPTDGTEVERNSFYLLDMPGERFSEIAEGRLANRELELLALKAAKALIIILPADEVLMDEQAEMQYPSESFEDQLHFGLTGKTRKRKVNLEKLAQDMARENYKLERFIANMIRFSAVLSLLEAGTDMKVIRAMDENALISYLDSGRYKPSRKPAFVALSKADVIETQGEEALKQIREQ